VFTELFTLFLQVDDAIALFWLLHNLLSHYEAMHVRVHQKKGLVCWTI